LNYIAKSNELAIFLKADADLAKELSKLSFRTKTVDQIDNLRSTLKINEDKFDERELKIYLEETLEFIND
jgi:hypothetical protein